MNEIYNLEKLKNRSAEMVLEKLENLLQEWDDFFHCEDCVLDLIAYTLNHVTPLYGTSLIGPLHPNRAKEKKIQIEVELALNNGIKKIKKNPHHEKQL